MLSEAIRAFWFEAKECRQRDSWKFGCIDERNALDSGRCKANSDINNINNWRGIV